METLVNKNTFVSLLVSRSFEIDVVKDPDSMFLIHIA